MDFLGTDSSLRALLDAREERWRRRLAFARRGVLLTLTLNLPGPDKILPGWLALHAAVRGDLARILLSGGVAFVHMPTRIEAAGPEDHFLFPPSTDPGKLKRAAVDFEERRPAGRLVDLDVMAVGGEPVGRDALGLSPRACFCCSRPGKECAALARHTADEVLAAAERLLEAFGRFSSR